MKQTPQFVSIGQAAIFLGVCQKTLRNWEREGKIRPIRTLGGHRRYSLAELKRKRPLLVAIGEAANRLGVCHDTLKRWEDEGRIPPRRTLGGHRRYSLAELERLPLGSEDGDTKNV